MKVQVIAMFKIVINYEKCVGCGDCISVCPSECYGDVKDGKITVVLEEECIGCRACESQCPEEAIEILDE